MELFLDSSSQRPDTQLSCTFLRPHAYYSHVRAPWAPLDIKYLVSSDQCKFDTFYSQNGDAREVIRIKCTPEERIRRFLRRLRRGNSANCKEKVVYEVEEVLVGYKTPSTLCFRQPKKKHYHCLRLLPFTIPPISSTDNDTPSLLEEPSPPIPPITVAQISSTANQEGKHFTIDYERHLIGQLASILTMPFYWGVIDRYQAEAVLDGKPEGSFLLRDSAQAEFVFSVSFRRFNRTLHARIGQRGHQFSFDPHDLNIFAAATLPDMLEHYKDPANCMFYEPMCCAAIHRTSVFSLQDLCRSSVVSAINSFDDVAKLSIPRHLIPYLRYYHYKVPTKVSYSDDVCS